MRRIPWLGLGLLATLAASAVIATSAAAEAPEFGRCIKVGGKAGKYSSGNCTKNVRGSVTESEFEWFPGPGAKNKFKLSGALSTFFETTEGSSGTCSAEKSSGEFVPGTDNKHVKTTLEYTGCKVVHSPGGFIDGAACQSSGRASGEVVTNALLVEAGWENKAKKETALVFGPETGNEFTTVFECAGFAFKVLTHGRGVLVLIKNDAMKLEEVVNFKQLKGIQEPSVWHLGEASEETAYLELTGPCCGGRSGLGDKLKLKGEEKLELNAVV